MIHSVYKTINLINQKYYIGKHSSIDPNDEYLGSGKALQRAIKKYGIANFKKEVLHLYEHEIDAYNKERELLEELNGVNDPLCYNLCYGGVGFWKGATHSVETRGKISRGNKGKVVSEEHKHKLRVFHTGKILTDETKRKLSEINTGKKLSSETKAKLIANSGMRGNTHTAEARAKISKAHTGRPSIRKGVECSEETKQKMSAAQKGRIVTEEAKEKLREYNGDKNSQFGSIWITDGNKNMKIKKDAIIPSGWSKGRTFKEGYKHVRN
jgi:group I intron endonuclease